MPAKNLSHDSLLGDSAAQSNSISGDDDRRGFIKTVSTIAMCGGLAAGYGTLAVMAGRFLYPATRRVTWMFVSEVKKIAAGEAIPFRSPAGIGVIITRKPEQVAGAEPTAEDFLALSSTCPHLGCRVHWEPHNDRFFCPCHNGIFDPEGNPTGGPPLADNQQLSTYPLKIESGLLYIEMPFASVVQESRQLAMREDASVGVRLEIDSIAGIREV